MSFCCWNSPLLTPRLSIRCFRLRPQVGKSEPKCDKSGTFSHQWAKTTETWSGKVPDLSHFGSIWHNLGPDPTAATPLLLVLSEEANGLSMSLLGAPCFLMIRYRSLIYPLCGLSLSGFDLLTNFPTSRVKDYALQPKRTIDRRSNDVMSLTMFTNR